MPAKPDSLRDYLQTLDPDLATKANNLWLVSRELHDRQGEADAHENGRNHIEMVERNAWRLLNTRHLDDDYAQLDRCNPQELFILSSAICCHDFDKALDSANPLPNGFRRHGVGSGAFVLENAVALGLTPQYAEAIKAAVSLHDLKHSDFRSSLTRTPEDHHTPFGKVRLHFIMIVLKAADVLQCDQSRIPSVAIDPAKLVGLSRRRYLARKCTRGWVADGSRIVIQASPRDTEQNAAIDDAFAFMLSEEWAAVREGLRRYGLPYDLQLEKVHVASTPGVVTPTDARDHVADAAPPPSPRRVELASAAQQIREARSVKRESRPSDLSAWPSPTRALRIIWELHPGSRTAALVVICSDTRNLPRPPLSADFGYCSRFGDVDALLEVLVHLARLFPATIAAKYPASQVPIEQKRFPLAILGGPLTDEDGRGGNSATARVNSLSPVPLDYELDDRPCLRVGERTYYTEYDAEDGSISQDAGLIIRCPSPWNSDVRALVFQGTHTFGVLGAVRSLTDPSVAEKNAALLNGKFGDDPVFLCPVHVGVDRGAVLAPLLQPRELFKWRA